MLNNMNLIAAGNTPVPDVGTQVANDLKDTVSSAAESAGMIIDKFPQFLSRLLQAAIVLVAGLLLLKLANSQRCKGPCWEHPFSIQSGATLLFSAPKKHFSASIFPRLVPRQLENTSIAHSPPKLFKLARTALSFSQKPQ